MSDGSGAVEAPSGRSLVLVATSDSATRNLLRQILHVSGVDLVDAADGVEVLALARKLALDQPPIRKQARVSRWTLEGSGGRTRPAACIPRPRSSR